ncbi:MAG: hypothetical protein WDO06_08105 [Actinomycetota bacterium]
MSASFHNRILVLGAGSVAQCYDPALDRTFGGSETDDNRRYARQ